MSVCRKIFPHALPLLYHFYQVHEREVHMLAIQQNNNKQGHSQFASRENGHVIFRSMIEESDSRGQVYRDKELDPIYFTKPLIKKLDKPFIFENVEEDEDKSVHLELKL
ncbi:hypothetical protein R3W88_016517 [Solanum pinnatisectum]|uniref:Uncharacterized protein n=1 Tax=Solanum pinnatisectum TaxID=50273 RepID=A0AAV9KXT4_9SOLN|nr:hypothetical protein R3W88_016517 [Solanum pinnatisectum]